MDDVVASTEFSLRVASGSFAQSWSKEGLLIETEIISNQWDGRLKV